MDFATSRTEIPSEMGLLPPPYTPPEEEMFGEEDDQRIPTTNITIHAPTTIHGSNNIVTMAPMDATRITAILMSALSQKSQAGFAGRLGQFNIQFNCGVNVIGDKNVVGNVGLRARPTASNAAGQSSARPTSPMPSLGSLKDAISGKRKAAEDPEGSSELQRPRIDTMAGSSASPP